MSTETDVVFDSAGAYPEVTPLRAALAARLRVGAREGDVSGEVLAGAFLLVLAGFSLVLCRAAYRRVRES